VYGTDLRGCRSFVGRAFALISHFHFETVPPNPWVIAIINQAASWTLKLQSLR
jgi:hypothetical protein